MHLMRGALYNKAAQGEARMTDARRHQNAFSILVFSLLMHVVTNALYLRGFCQHRQKNFAHGQTRLLCRRQGPLERLVNTRHAYIVPPSFVSELKKLLETEHTTPKDLEALCDRHVATVSTFLLAGVQRAGRPLPEIEKAMEDAAAREMGALRSKVRPLTVAGSVTPLVGLLGTVVGMIIAFKTASQAGLGKGEMLAQGNLYGTGHHGRRSDERHSGDVVRRILQRQTGKILS